METEGVSGYTLGRGNFKAIQGWEQTKRPLGPRNGRP